MATTATKKEFQRLPTDVVPVNYCLELKPDLQNFTFDGKVTITVAVQKATKQVKLNAAELEIERATIRSPDGGWLAGTGVQEE